MCGFAGFLGAEAPDQPEAVLRAMADALRNRGPDDAGVWFDGQAGVGLAHRRLAIVDLTPARHQPMRSPCGRFVLAYNGEIYNIWICAQRWRPRAGRLPGAGIRIPKRCSRRCGTGE